MALDVERLKLVNGFVFPKEDEECSAVVFDELKKLDQIPCKGYGVAVQAGANVGVFPISMIARFDKVYTFEPDPLNYECLVANLDRFVTPEMGAQVMAVHGGLSDKRGKGRITSDYTHVNCGALQMSDDSGDIDLIALDDMEIEGCDLIYLDIEGFEDKALRGARKTIEKYKPVIVCENKGLIPDFPATVPNPSLEFRQWVCKEFGYQFHSRLMRDDVFVCTK